LVWLGLFALPAVAADPTLAQRIETIIDGPDYTQAHWGILVANAKGETVYSRNAEKLFTPASTTKLYSCAAMLIAYGADYRFETPVYARGEVDQLGVLRGDLILVGRGDLGFGGRTTKDGKMAFANSDHTYANGSATGADLTDTNPLAALEDLAAQVKAAKIREIAGEVLIDDRLFAKARGTGSGPDAVSPIIVNDNLIDLIITPAEKAGQLAKVVSKPDLPGLFIDSEVQTVNAKGATTITINSVGPLTFTVRGQIPANSKPIVRIAAIEDPALFARVAFIDCLRKQGIRVRASVAKPGIASLPPSEDLAKLKPIAMHQSPPLSEALKVTLKVSHNLYASTLPCLVAVKSGKRTQEEGLREQGRLLQALGVDVKTISFAGGAGGAWADCVTPKATVQLLQAMRKRDDWSVYKAALPSLGVDGTLAGIVPDDSPARGKVFAKTGTLAYNNSLNGNGYSLLRSKALAGTMTTSKGTELFFAMFVNNAPLGTGVGASREGKVLGKLSELIFLYGG
jgi:D-alanyl-D-alanine carboxypeptidase/D-alanyl-D-alanine-endopeptidase (penicillin-binding protein 4)